MVRAREVCCLILMLLFCPSSVMGESPLRRWQQSESSVALLQDDDLLWQFNHGRNVNVPYFHPVSVLGGRVLTWDRPADHAWHHGLWFSWKYINRVNYWEHDRQTGKPAGRTEWSNVEVETRHDHSARIVMMLAYHPAVDDQIVLTERRSIDISAPDPEGEFYFDWTAEFTAGDGPVELDRTPPKAQSWGGYAGLSVRFARDLEDRQATSADGPVQFGPGMRHRSRSTAMDYSGIIDGRAVGVAIFDHPENPRHPTPWYVIRSPIMGYVNAALLNDEPMLLKAGERMTLRYRLTVHPQRFDAPRLQKALAQYWRSVSPD